MALNKNHFWFTIVTLFTIWFFLIFLNYSSLILNVRSLTKVYINSVSKQQQQLIPGQPSNLDGTIKENVEDDKDDEDDDDSLDIDLSKLPKQPEVPHKDEYEVDLNNLQVLQSDPPSLIPMDPDPSSLPQSQVPLNHDPSSLLMQPNDLNPVPENPLLDNPQPDNPLPLPDNPQPDNLLPLRDNPQPNNPFPLPENSQSNNPLISNPQLDNPLPDNPLHDNPLPLFDHVPSRLPPNPKRRGKRRGKRKGKSKPRKTKIVKPVREIFTDLVQPISETMTEPVELVREAITDLVEPVTKVATEMVGVASPNLNLPLPLSPHPPPKKQPQCNTEIKFNPESCKGRYIYIQTLPRRYNVDLLRDCANLDQHINMCKYIKNFGLGPPLPVSNHVFSESGWYATHQYLLEVIFHNRMKMYDCLTNISSQAQAIFIPFYSGLDVTMHLWNNDYQVRDSASLDLVNLLKRKREWKQFWGRDHFFVGGRITWDFRRSSNDSKHSNWGTNFLYLPEVKNMTALLTESSPWNKNDFGIPYPTYFHPSNDDEMKRWQERMRQKNRRYLFSFVGGSSPDQANSISDEIIMQCRNSNRCKLVRCKDSESNDKCRKPTRVMNVFQSSYFCLQPPGDSYTRRSIFDAIVAGCIPVFFHPGSAYIQYLWHFPSDYRKYSVFMSLFDVKDKRVSIEDVLARIPTQKVWDMRDEVVNLIPRVVYSNPRCKLERVEDAFDLAVKGVLERVGRIKEDMKEGRDDSFGYDERLAWKYEWIGKARMQDDHQWDHFF